MTNDRRNIQTGSTYKIKKVITTGVLCTADLYSLVEVPEADGVDDLQHALVGGEGVRLLLEDLVDPAPQKHTSSTNTTLTLCRVVETRKYI